MIEGFFINLWIKMKEKNMKMLIIHIMNMFIIIIIKKKDLIVVDFIIFLFILELLMNYELIIQIQVQLFMMI
jgi:hypothetical protein